MDSINPCIHSTIIFHPNTRMNNIQRHLLLIMGGLGLCSGVIQAQTFNWGSAVFSDLVDSNGNPLDNTFVFEVGAFRDDFIPDATNFSEWYGHWQAFDRAAYNGIEAVGDDGIHGYFTSTANMNSGGTSDSAWQTPGALSFEGLNAYVWIRNSNLAEPGSEWMLARADDWVFPVAEEDCCGNNLPIEWSTSDLTASDTPVWGAQGSQTGGGLINIPGNFTLQTATFVPEPSALLLSFFSGILLCIHRKRLP